MKQFLVFVQKEFHHVFRDGKTLLMLFGMPITLIILLGFAVTNEIKNAKIVICDYANDVATLNIINRIANNKAFTLESRLMSHTEIEKALQRNDIKLAIIIPAGFNQSLLHLNQAQVQIIADASDPNTATSLTNYATSVIMEYQQNLIKAQNLPFTITSEIRMYYNPELKSAVNFVPGIMALVLLLVCVLMTAVSIVKEKEKGTMEVLLVSPLHPLLIIVAKAIPYLALSLINLGIILLLSSTLLQIHIYGSILLLVLESTLYIVCCLSLGLLISNSTQSQQAAMLLALMGMMVPALLFSGFMFPLENMPVPLQWVAQIFPSKWYYTIAKSVMVKGLEFHSVWKETLVLLGMSLTFLIISLRTFKIRLT